MNDSLESGIPACPDELASQADEALARGDRARCTRLIEQLYAALDSQTCKPDHAQATVICGLHSEELPRVQTGPTADTVPLERGAPKVERRRTATKPIAGQISILLPIEGGERKGASTEAAQIERLADAIRDNGRKARA